MSRRQNKINRAQTPQPRQQPQQPQMRINLAEAEDVVCDSCGNYTFQSVVLMKRLSPILSPTGEEALIPVQVFACNACGFVNKDFLPRVATENSEETKEVSGVQYDQTDQDTVEKAEAGPIITTDIR